MVIRKAGGSRCNLPAEVERTRDPGNQMASDARRVVRLIDDLYQRPFRRGCINVVVCCYSKKMLNKIQHRQVLLNRQYNHYASRVGHAPNRFVPV